MKRNWLYLITTTGVVLISFVTGIGNLIPFPHIESDLQHLGYPAYFRIILGTWKVIAAVVIAIPGGHWTKNLAYMGILLDLSGAAASRWAIGDALVTRIVPLVIAGWVAISWWNFRKRTYPSF